jgi:hypothetical protein
MFTNKICVRSSFCWFLYARGKKQLLGIALALLLIAVRVYSERNCCCFSHLIDLHAHLMGTKMYYCKANHALDPYIFLLRILLHIGHSVEKHNEGKRVSGDS